MKNYLIGFIVIAAVGCAATGQWTKPGADQHQFQADKEACIHSTTLPRGMHIESAKAHLENTAVPACLRAKGWTAGESQP
jgi:hypothetical protein